MATLLQANAKTNLDDNAHSRYPLQKCNENNSFCIRGKKWIARKIYPRIFTILNNSFNNVVWRMTTKNKRHFERCSLPSVLQPTYIAACTFSEGVTAYLRIHLILWTTKQVNIRSGGLPSVTWGGTCKATKEERTDRNKILQMYIFYRSGDWCFHLE